MKKKYMIEDISRQIKSGLTPYRENKKYWENGNIPWLKTEQLGIYKIYDTNEKITEYALKNTNISLIEPNSIVLAMYGEGVTRGKVSILGKEMTTNQACINITVNEDLADYRYVYYYLKDSYQRLRGLASGVRRNLNSSMIKKFEIYLPSIIEQKIIADKIEIFDKKIESNKVLITKLEEYSRLLFLKWFVDFNFLNNEGKPYKSVGGKMVELNGSVIPSGWKVEKLSKSADFINGLAMQKFPPQNEKERLPVIKIKEISNGGFHKFTEYVTKSVDEKLVIKNGDILFPWSGSLSVSVWSGGTGVLNQHIFKVSSEKYHNWFLLQWIKHHMSYFEKIAYGKKTTMGHINRKHLGMVNVYIPDSVVLDKMNSSMIPLYNRLIQIKQESVALEEMRDILIKKLIK